MAPVDNLIERIPDPHLRAQIAEEVAKLVEHKDFGLVFQRHLPEWACNDGHMWEASPATRGLANSGCPFCAGQRAWPGHTDLRTTHPDLAKEWDKTRGRNAGDPDHVSPDSGRRINWRCRSGHQWQAPIRVRVTEGRGCPYCAGTRLWKE